MKPYKIPNNITVSDLVVLLYGTTDLSGQFMSDNPWITSLAFDLTDHSGAIVYFNPLLTQATPANLTYKTTPPVTTALYKVQQGQTIYDICAQIYGSLDYLGKLIADNELYAVYLSPDQMVGTLLSYDPTLTANSAIFNAHKNKNIVYATAGINDLLSLQGASFDDSFDNSFENGRP